MPWKMVEPMDQKISLISDWNAGELNVTDLSNKYDVSRKTIYKWVKRYILDGVIGLEDKSREPIHHPNQTEAHVVHAILQEKEKHLSWGPKKIIKRLTMLHPDQKWPHASTAGAWLLKNGMVQPRKPRKHIHPYADHFIECKKPNDVWSIDYKGQFHTTNKKICYPLTITDNFSRYLIDCTGLEGPRYAETRDILERRFREFGVPKAIRSDNGTPFAGTGLGGLSRLSIWWIKLGIRPERIDLGAPQQNGRHERMHRTLKAETVTPAANSLQEQQMKFDTFRGEFNMVRPHEALNFKTPAMVYEESPRKYQMKPIIYDTDHEVRSIRGNGLIKFSGQVFYISELLRGEHIGLKEISDGIWKIYFSFHGLGYIDLHKRKVMRYVRKV